MNSCLLALALLKPIRIPQVGNNVTKGRGRVYCSVRFSVIELNKTFSFHHYCSYIILYQAWDDGPGGGEDLSILVKDNDV